ncbi:hypothetical protein [Dehalobacterium formicoaceticum]|uniref:Uncharacterized protein n=1 Tax=Dehalobacterium formicoaceticum TaxID=51515 RepID=A0ABT1Y5T8_9FIRM|nr:hypothetical protein [Dehalobacterium formicoaceticum]MCR6545918.1 hypothetical protein [Dehalobacterium formicoaceticum]
MKHHIKSLGLTFVIASLFFALLMGGRFLYQNQYMADRFQAKLGDIPGVTEVRIEDRKIILTMNKVSNIKASFQEAANIVGKRDYEIIIKDRPSKELESLVLECEIPLQEGLMRGNFTEMTRVIQEICRNRGIDARIFLDQERIYLSISSENHYLYRIIERPDFSPSMYS